MNTHLHNPFQIATATAANTPGFHNNRIGAQTVRNRLRENDFHAQRTLSLDTATLEYRHFFRMNQDFLYSVVMAVCACTIGEKNAMLTVVFLYEIVSGVGVLSWSGQPLPMVIVHHLMAI